jgi:hypothetical protein
MLSPSPSKITDLAILGASLRPADLAATRKTAKHEFTCGIPKRGTRR